VNLLPLWAIGAVLAALVAIAARRVGALTTGGAIAAAAVGTAAMTAGWSWGVVLVAYFVSSTALGRWQRERRDALTAGRLEKPGARDTVQVLANGGVFAATAVVYWLAPDPLWQLLAVGALATSASDTWATEIGTLSSTPPRSLFTGAVVPPGTSGGVSPRGLLGAFAGAAFVAAIAWAVGWPRAPVAAALFGGLFGCLLDSALGATLQARGWLNNDGVNAVSTVGGAIAGAAIGRVL